MAMERIGIYGGTFNPPHIGHIQAAKQAVKTLQLDKLLLIPDRVAPHKEIPDNSPSPWQRLDMLRIAAGQDPAITPPVPGSGWICCALPQARTRRWKSATLS